MAVKNYKDNADEYWDKVDPDVTGDGDGGPLPDRPSVGDLGPDNVEKAREEIHKWNEKNLDNWHPEQ